MEGGTVLTFIIEAVIACLLFAAFVIPSVRRDPLAWIEDYPPAIVDRVRELGLIDNETRMGSKEFIKVKLIKSLLVAIVLSLLVMCVNDAHTLTAGFAISYALWFVVTWFDTLVMDCFWFTKSERVRIPGTEDMEDEYRNVTHHFKMGVCSTLFGLPVCLLVGIFTALVNYIF